MCTYGYAFFDRKENIFSFTVQQKIFVRFIRSVIKKGICRFFHLHIFLVAITVTKNTTIELRANGTKRPLIPYIRKKREYEEAFLTSH